MKTRHATVLISSICLLSCTGNRESDVMTFRLDRSDYIEKINVPGTVQPVLSTPVNSPRSSYGQMTVSRIAEDGAFVRKGDTLCVLSVPEAEAVYRDTQKSIEKLEAELRKAEADNNLNIATLQAGLEDAEARLRITSLDSLKMKYVPKFQQDLMRLEIRKALIEKEKIEKKLASAKKIGESDIRQQNARIVQEKMKSQSLADQIKAMTIIAGKDGVVMRAESPKYMVMSSVGAGVFGGPVREGSVLFIDATLLKFPDLSRMQVSADVAEADFRRIEKGQKVIISVDAAGNLITTGKVNRKSLATSEAQRYSGSKVKTYEVIIDVDSCHEKMKPGLSTSCEIILKEEKDTLFVPTLAIFQKDSSGVVYVKRKNKFVPVKVGTGTAGDSYTIITSGLTGDEMIALIEPPESMIVHDKQKKDGSHNNHQ